jgi:hypothetical protein
MKNLLCLLLLCVAVSAPAQRPRAVDACSRLDYYWEIGDRSGVLGSGRVGSAAPTAGAPIDIASASKWLYGALALQARPIPTADDVRFLTMTSGFETFSLCTRFQTVATCAAAGDNDRYTPADDGRFFYSGAHMQQHAVGNGLGPLTPAGLGPQVSRALGVTVAYGTPQLAGGAVIAPSEFGAFLRKLMRNELALAPFLGTFAVCTNPATCATSANSPIPADWFYSLGHWVEDDGTFSSPGAFGFYPWISGDRSLYGIVVTEHGFAGNGWTAAQCGRQIRNSWRATH